MRYTRIAIDIDDTVADSTEALRVVVNSLLETSLTSEDYKHPGEYWGYYERVWRRHGIADLLSFSELNRQMAIDQSHVPLIDGAHEAVRQLQRDTEVLLITSRDPSWESATRKWFSRHFAQNELELYFCASHVDESAKTKGELCRDLGAQLLIDDNASHCKTALDAGVDAILFGEYGWHHGVTFSGKRYKTWREALVGIYE